MWIHIKGFAVQAPASAQPFPVVQAASVVEAITAVEENNNSWEDCLGEDKEDVDEEECKDDDDVYEDDDEEEEQEEVVGVRLASIAVGDHWSF